MSSANIIKEEKHDLERKILELVRKFENLNDLQVGKINVKCYSGADRKYIDDINISIVI